LKRLAGVVTRGVVLITSVLLWAPLLRFGMGLLEKVQEAPAGRPEHDPSDTDCGMMPVGVTVTV
jgi:hypothetical protein